MHHIEVAGLRLPAIGFGTWRLYGQDCTDGVLDALAIGYRLFDTATRYDNEEAVGAALAATTIPRDEILISTKLPLDCTAPMARAAALESLRKLRTDYVDILLMHWPNNDVPDEETLGEMALLREEGLVRGVGVSNFPPSRLDRAVEVTTIVANQVEYHPYLSQRAVLESAQRHGHAIMAYSPLARARVNDDPVLTEIGREHGKTASQVALRWQIQQPQVVTIPKTGSAQRRRANFDILDFALTDDQMAAIHRLDEGFRLIDTPFAPDWER